MEGLDTYTKLAEQGVHFGLQQPAKTVTKGTEGEGDAATAVAKGMATKGKAVEAEGGSTAEKKKKTSTYKVDESKFEGRVTTATYWNYIKRGGGVLSAVVLCILMVGGQVRQLQNNILYSLCQFQNPQFRNRQFRNPPKSSLPLF